jgi:hypothetical protein
MDMKLYVLSVQDYETFILIGVFSTNQKAQSVIDKEKAKSDYNYRWGDYVWNIKECLIDEDEYGLDDDKEGTK